MTATGGTIRAVEPFEALAHIGGAHRQTNPRRQPPTATSFEALQYAQQLCQGVGIQSAPGFDPAPARRWGSERGSY